MSLRRQPRQSSTRSRRVSQPPTWKTYADQTAGGKAAIAPGSVADGKKVIDAAVKAFGTVHILINNAGIIRKSSSEPVMAMLIFR
jgi:NAD(P)-dependent dehydrogenase (short-subunit alcohol dehydrogenase family)